jgi:hypothetical protein
MSPDVERSTFNQHWQLIFQETAVAFGCQALFKRKRPDDLASNNTALNANRRTTLKKGFRECLAITD